MMGNRPDPDQFLKRAKAEESRRGKLKIFFGAVAGVGKTYAMLEAARARKKEGVDVLAGYVETHKRPETEALLEGLEALPRKTIPYRNVSLPEFDIDAALKRNPSLILVDELAHTNAPGSRHLKRWQDVEELLNAGINVYTTLNVQHCESVNDVVAQVTNVIVRETVPDTFLEKADEMELIDLPSEDLLKRLKEGKVYLGAQAERAAQNFFQPGNLIALRQLALRYTASKVDTQMRSFKEMHSISKIWNVGERFLVCISESPASVNLIRAARRIASEIGASWTVAYVESASLRHTEEGKKRASETLRFAERLGAEVITLGGQDVSDELIAYARANNITKLIIGKPSRTRWQELIFGSIVNELARKCGEIDLYVISGERQGAGPVRTGIPKKKFSWENGIRAIAVVALCTGVNCAFSRYLDPTNLILIYLLGVVWIAFRFGIRISFLASLASVLLFDYLFVPPYYSFTVADSQDLVTFFTMFIVGFLISSLTNRLRQQTIAIRAREKRHQILYELTQDLAKTSTPNGLFQALLHHVRNYFKLPVAIFTPGPQKALSVRDEKLEGFELSANEMAVAQWAYEHRQKAGQGTETLPASQGLYLPLTGMERTLGVVGLFPAPKKNPFSDPEQLHLLEMFVNQTALAVEGAELALAALRAEDEVEKERVHNLLLSTFSYELPGPLSEIAQAAEELLKPEVSSDETKKTALIKQIREKARELNKLTEELPKILESEQ